MRGLATALWSITVANPHVGLLFFIPGVNDTVRVNGTAAIVDKQELDSSTHCGHVVV